MRSLGCGSSKTTQASVFRAALFETTVQGEPLSFSFARTVRRDGTDECAVSSLARSLFGAMHCDAGAAVRRSGGSAAAGLR